MVVLKVLNEDVLVDATKDFCDLDRRGLWGKAQARCGRMDHTSVGVAVVLNLARSCDRCFDAGVELGMLLNFEPMVDATSCATCAGRSALRNNFDAGRVNDDR